MFMLVNAAVSMTKWYQTRHGRRRSLGRDAWQGLVLSRSS